jgi:hypothetical protein
MRTINYAEILGPAALCPEKAYRMETFELWRTKMHEVIISRSTTIFQHGEDLCGWSSGVDSQIPANSTKRLCSSPDDPSNAQIKWRTAERVLNSSVRGSNRRRFRRRFKYFWHPRCFWSVAVWYLVECGPRGREWTKASRTLGASTNSVRGKSLTAPHGATFPNQ